MQKILSLAAAWRARWSMASGHTVRGKPCKQKTSPQTQVTLWNTDRHVEELGFLDQRLALGSLEMSDAEVVRGSQVGDKGSGKWYAMKGSVREARCEKAAKENDRWIKHCTEASGSAITADTRSPQKDQKDFHTKIENNKRKEFACIKIMKNVKNVWIGASDTLINIKILVILKIADTIEWKLQLERRVTRIKLHHMYMSKMLLLDPSVLTGSVWNQGENKETKCQMAQQTLFVPFFMGSNVCYNRHQITHFILVQICCWCLRVTIS
jgi:hypothetical protein